VQALKHEPFADGGALGRMLLRRALREPVAVGHKLYWLLKSEVRESR
jgi:hypothetical protein